MNDYIVSLQTHFLTSSSSINHRIFSVLNHGQVAEDLNCSRMLIISYHIQTCCSVAQSYPRHHGLKHTRLPYPSLSPRVCSISCLLGWCYNPTISSSALPTFSSCPVFLNMRIFSSESALHIKSPKYQSFSFIISPSNDYSGLTSFRTDLFYLLSVEGTIKSLFQHHRLKASILQLNLFLVQLSHLDRISGKTVASTVQTFVKKVMPLLFNTLSRFVIVFLSCNRHLLISRLQSPSAMILEPKKIKSVTVYIQTIDYPNLYSFEVEREKFLQKQYIK